MMKKIITDTGSTIIQVSTAITLGYSLVCIDMYDEDNKDSVTLTDRREVESMIKALQNSLDYWDSHQIIN